MLASPRQWNRLTAEEEVADLVGLAKVAHKAKAALDDSSSLSEEDAQDDSASEDDTKKKPVAKKAAAKPPGVGMPLPTDKDVLGAYQAN